jgi:predicted acyltransferase
MLLLAFNTEMFAEIRIPGVLQRIGIVYFAAALLYLFFSTRNQIIIVATFLIGYYLLMAFVDVPGIGNANFDKATNLSAWMDGILFKNHMYSATKTWDPEGSLSTLPAIANGLLGCLLGQFIIKVQDKNLMVKQLSLIGIGLIFLGLGWNVFFPINKALWSSSYVLFTAGLGSVILALLYYIIDIRKKQNWSKLFVIWGVNPMIVFFFSGIIPRVLGLIKFDDPNNLSETINLQSYLYKNYIAAFFTNPMNASLAGSLVYVVIWTFILWIFYKRNLIFKV